MITRNALPPRAVSSRLRIQWADLLLTALLIGSILLVWWVFTLHSTSSVYSNPGEIVADIYRRLQSGQLLPEVWSSTCRIVPSLLLGTISGYATALLLVISAPRWRIPALAIIAIAFGISTISVFFLFKLWMPYGELPKLAINFWVAYETQLILVFWPMSDWNAGLGNVAEVAQLQTARVLGATRWQLLRNHLFYQGIPISHMAFIFAAKTVIVISPVVEAYAPHSGIGLMLSASSEDLHAVGIYSNTLITALGVLLTILIGRVPYKALSGGRM